MTNDTDAQSLRKTWFITGATSGIGHALTAAALKRGDNVAATGRSVDTLSELSASYPDSLLVVEADVRDEAAVQQAVASATAKFGGLDVAVNNAAVGIFAGIEEITDAQWHSIFDSNFFSTMTVLRAVLPTFRAQGHGHILLGSAHYGQSSHAGVGGVAATKHALEGVTDSLRDELTPLGLKVTTFEPGFTATEFLRRLTFGENASTDYDDTVRATYAGVGQMPAEAFNSADAVADILLKAVDADAAPLRLAVGSASYNMMKASLEARLQNLADWADASLAVDSFGK
jgi:NADP-dependent 3-hydroxy acid dehydrogenase YdfG